MGQRRCLTSFGAGHLYLVCLIFLVCVDSTSTSILREEDFESQSCVTSELGQYSRLGFALPFSLFVRPLSRDWTRLAVYLDRNDSTPYHFNVYNEGGNTTVSLHDENGANLWEEDELPSVGRSLQMVLAEEVLGFSFDEGNGEDEEDEENEENEESVTSSGDFTFEDEDNDVSGQNREAKEATESRWPKMKNFSMPELDLKDIRSVLLYSVGKPTKFCVSKGTRRTATSAPTTQSSPVEGDQADQSYSSQSPEKTTGEDGVAGRSSADPEQSYLTQSAGKATEDPERGSSLSPPMEYDSGRYVEKGSSTRQDQQTSHSAFTRPAEETTRTETGGRSVPPGTHASQADRTLEGDRLRILGNCKIITIVLGGLLSAALLALTLAGVYVRILKQRNRRLLASDCATLRMTRDEVMRLILGPIALDVQEPPSVEVVKSVVHDS